MPPKNDTPAAKAGTNPAGGGPSSQGKNGSSKNPAESIAGLEVISIQDGFRRAGLAWSKAPIRFARSELTEAQIKMLKEESMLTVRDIEIKAEDLGK